MIDHRNGCAVVRTGRCTCAYLNQWDTTRLAGPGILIIPDHMWADFTDLASVPGAPTIIRESEYRHQQTKDTP